MKLISYILYTLLFIIKLILAVINGVFISIYHFFYSTIRRLRFSISFKLNLFYTLSYSLLTLLILTGYFYYLNYIATQSSNDFTQVLSSFSDSIPYIVVGSLIIFAVIGNSIAHKLLSPIKTMTQNVKQLDVTTLARLNTDLAKDELKDLALTFNEMLDRLELYMNKQKQFVSDASHELRTPIAIIQGYTDMLQRWGKNDPNILDESIASLCQETANMKELLEKLLFLSRSDKKTLKLCKSTFNLSKLFEQITKEIEFIDDTHYIEENIQKDILFTGDEALIKELIRIFIDNALKYTPEGGTITLSCISIKNNIILSIKDTGVGIPEACIPFLFERFYRVDEARTKDTGGSGLGLAIAKEIIDLHDGEISITSEPSVGTNFIIFLNKPTSLT